MNLIRRDHVLSISLICILGLILVRDLFAHPGIPATFDGPTHITTWHQVATILREEPGLVTWLDNFGNYGSPISMYVHQTTMYLGAALELLTGSAELSFALIMTLGTIIGSIGVYTLILQHTSKIAALLAALLFTIAPYKILNIYSRGAIPEYFTMSLAPWLLYVGRQTYLHPTFRRMCIWALMTALMILSHVYVVIIALPLCIAYAAALFAERPPTKRALTLLTTGLLIGIGIASYYLVPLITESQYFHYSKEANHAKAHQHLNLVQHFIIEQWPFETPYDTYTKPHIVQAGTAEFFMFVAGIVAAIWLALRKQAKKHALFIALVLTAGIYVALQLQPTFWLFQKIPLLGNIQHQWRMMAGFSLVIPMLAALFANSNKKTMYALWAIMLIVLIIRIPAMTGKNYSSRPNSHYDFVAENLHGNAMTTAIWAEQTDRYPIMDHQADIIEGEGTITKANESNSKRQYTIQADTDVRMVDYTFYFPGWNAYIDGQKVPIEFQDPTYRGVITYRVPAGVHDIRVIFEHTRKRQAGYAISLFSLALLGLCVYYSYAKNPGTR